MKCEVLLVTHARDLPYLRYALESIAKFGSGFSGVNVLHPEQEHEEFEAISTRIGMGEFEHITKRVGYPMPIRFTDFDQFPGKGMLDHEAQILLADEHCPEADYIFHTDSDCVFREPFSPQCYFTGDGRPVLLVEPYELLKTKHPGRYQWRDCVTRALGFEPKWETMCRHPSVYPRKVYKHLRAFMEDKWKIPQRHYVLMQRDEYPQGFAEFPTLGAFAMEDLPETMQFVDVSIEKRPRDKLVQFWGHGPIDRPQEIWLDGKKQIVIPKVMIDEILGG